MKEIILIGGPNGAGKTTTARVLMPEFFAQYPFLNADDIARSLAPWDVESAALAAGRLMIERMRMLVRNDQSFALESTLSGKSFLRFLQNCKERGWRVTLLYFWLKSPELSVERVAHRVREGGHDIPVDVIYRRYAAGVSNLVNLYLPLADEAEIYDNSDRMRVLIAERQEGGILVVHDSNRWAKIKRLAQ